MHGRRHRQAVRQCFVCRIGRQIGVQIDAAGQAKAQRAFARNTLSSYFSVLGYLRLGALRVAEREPVRRKTRMQDLQPRSGSYPITGSLAVDSGWRSRPRSCGRSAQFPRSEYRNSPRTFGLQYQQSGRLQWAFACIFKRVATIVPRNPKSNQRPNLLLLCMFFPWCPWPVSNRAGLKWGVALASHASRFLREEAFAVERDAPDAIRTCDLCFRKAELRSGDCLKQQFEMVACPRFEPAR